MEEKLKKIKELLEMSFEDEKKRDMFIGQAIGLLDSVLIDVRQSPNLPIPDAVRQHMSNTHDNSMLNAVQRHKEVHKELTKDSITQKNTQFEKLI